MSQVDVRIDVDEDEKEMSHPEPFVIYLCKYLPSIKTLISIINLIRQKHLAGVRVLIASLIVGGVGVIKVKLIA